MGRTGGGFPSLLKKLTCPPLHVPLLFCPKNVDFLIFMPFLDILLKLSPHKSIPFGKPDHRSYSGAIKCTSPSLESLESRRRLRCLCVLHKIISNELPAYLRSGGYNGWWSVIKTSWKLRIINQKSHWKSHINCFIIFYHLFEYWPITCLISFKSYRYFCFY